MHARRFQFYLITIVPSRSFTNRKRRFFIKFFPNIFISPFDKAIPRAATCLGSRVTPSVPRTPYSLFSPYSPYQFAETLTSRVMPSLPRTPYSLYSPYQFALFFRLLSASWQSLRSRFMSLRHASCRISGASCASGTFHSFVRAPPIPRTASRPPPPSPKKIFRFFHDHPLTFRKYRLNCFT